MRKYYEVSINYNEGIFGSNIAFAENENDIKAHYEAKGYEVIATTEANERAVESARERGKPIVTIEHKDEENILNIDEEMKDIQKKADAIEVECLCEFSNGYVEDIGFQIVADKVNIYYADLEKWLTDTDNSWSYMEQAIFEGYIDINKYSFSEHIQSAQSIYFEEEFNRNLNAYKTYFVMNELLKKGITELTEEQCNSIQAQLTGAQRIGDLQEIATILAEVSA